MYFSSMIWDAERLLLLPIVVCGEDLLVSVFGLVQRSKDILYMHLSSSRGFAANTSKLNRYEMFGRCAWFPG